MEPGRGIPPKSNIHELAHLIKLFKGKYGLAEVLLKPLQSVGCSVITWSPAFSDLTATRQLLGPAGEESSYSSGEVRWGEHKGKAALPHCRLSAFWHQQSKHTDSAFLNLPSHLSNFKSLLKTIDFCSWRMVLSCVYLAASLRAFKEPSSDFHVLFSKCKRQKLNWKQKVKYSLNHINSGLILPTVTSIWSKTLPSEGKW